MPTTPREDLLRVAGAGASDLVRAPASPADAPASARPGPRDRSAAGTHRGARTPRRRLCYAPGAMVARATHLPLSAALLLAGCTRHEEPRPPPAPAVSGAAYTTPQIRSEVEDLLRGLTIDATRRVELLERLDTFLAGDEFVGQSQHAPVRAVGVYHWAEGGVVVKIARGDGRVRFIDAPAAHRIRLKYTSVGAQIGGSSSWGVLLATNLPDLAALEGTYVGEVRSATAIDASAGILRMVHRTHGDRVYFIGVAAGLSADAGESEMVIAFDPPLP